MSTVDPGFSREMAAAAHEHGLRFLDAPVAGSKAPAASGELVILAGGDASDVQEAAPIFAILGKKTIHCGPQGSGASMKLAVNLMLGHSLAAFAEANLLGRSLGLEQSALMDVVLATPVAAPVLGVLRQKLEANNTEANFPLKHMRKDLGLALQSAEAAGAELQLTRTASELYASAERRGRGDEDFSSLFHALGGE